MIPLDEISRAFSNQAASSPHEIPDLLKVAVKFLGSDHRLGW
jgi:hypothetical protein